MFKASRIVVITLLLIGVSYCQQERTGPQTRATDGEYAALEKMANVSPDEPRAKWFHENTLLIRNNEAILDEVPVWFKGNKKFYSASDGGFLTYRARFSRRGEDTVVELRLFQSDYVMLPVGRDPYKEIKTRSVKFVSGEIDINGVRYKRTTISKTKLDALLQMLHTEPMEEVAVH